MDGRAEMDGWTTTLSLQLYGVRCSSNVDDDVRTVPESKGACSGVAKDNDRWLFQMCLAVFVFVEFSDTHTHTQKYIQIYTLFTFPNYT